jgi:hypothetical protein
VKYSSLYASRAQRAVEIALIEVRGVVSELASDGVPLERINELLVDDLETSGMLFGRFFRTLTAAGEMAIAVAASQASSVAEAGALCTEDPRELEQLENDLADELVTWVAVVTRGVERRDADRCLVLHGARLPRAQWRSAGYRPGLMHARCGCQWVSGECGMIEPLTRNVAPGQQKGGRLTVRGIEGDIGTQAALERAVTSPQGSTVRRALGQE